MPKITGTIYRKTIQRCVDVPKDALPRSLQCETRPPVIVTIDGRMFESTLLPRDSAHFQLVVPMAILRELRRDTGDSIAFLVKHDPTRQAPEVPDELFAVLRGNPRARQVFAGLSISLQRQIVRFIDSARSESTRLNRAERMTARLLSWETKD